MEPSPDPCAGPWYDSIDGTNFVTRFDYTIRAQRGVGFVDPSNALTSPDSVGDAGSSHRDCRAGEKDAQFGVLSLRDGRCMGLIQQTTAGNSGRSKQAGELMQGLTQAPSLFSA